MMIPVVHLLTKTLRYYRNYGVQRTVAKIIDYRNKRRRESGYHELVLNERLSPQARDAAEREQAEWGYRPLISIVVPVYNIDPTWLHAAVESIRQQIYTNWELCLFDDCSTRQDTLEYLRQLAEGAERRIKVAYGIENGGIVVATNSSIEMSAGEYVAFMDNDDELEETALYEIVKALQSSTYDFIYTDEDKIDFDGKYVEPYYKPNWSPHLYQSGNYTSHFAVYARRIGDRLSWLREGYDGSQDYDFTLRFSEVTTRILHIPKVLYHWRKIPGSTSADPYAKPYAYLSARQALQDSVHRRGYDARIEQTYPGHYRTRWSVPNHAKILVLLIVDNSVSEPALREWEHKVQLESKWNPTIQISRLDGTMVSFGDVVNGALSNDKYDFLVLFSEIALPVEVGWMSNIIEVFQDDTIGVVGPKVVGPNETIVHGGLVFDSSGQPQISHLGWRADSQGYHGALEDVKDYLAISGCISAFRVRDIMGIGGFNTNTVSGDWLVIDMCLRLKKRALWTVYSPYATFRVEESKQIKDDETMRVHWASVTSCDPFYREYLVAR